jgi:hypothetical protein
MTSYQVEMPMCNGKAGNPDLIKLILMIILFTGLGVQKARMDRARMSCVSALVRAILYRTYLICCQNVGPLNMSVGEIHCQAASACKG